MYVHETDLEQNCELLASMSGATIFDKLVPFLTTHIVCTKETVQLRTALGRMYSDTMAGSATNKAALTTDQSAVELVTLEWIKVSLVNQRLSPVRDFRPEIVKIHVQSAKKLQPTY